MYGGEIDIIAERDKVIAFVEVKNWSFYGYGELGRAVNKDKRRRIIRAARGFMSSAGAYENYRIRFDVIFISGENFVHTEDAFTETDTI
jgi:putative endonuclease